MDQVFLNVESLILVGVPAGLQAREEKNISLVFPESVFRLVFPSKLSWICQYSEESILVPTLVFERLSSLAVSSICSSPKRFLGWEWLCCSNAGPRKI